MVTVTHEGQTFTVNSTLIVIECYKCHCLFGMSEDLDTRARKTKISFHCPLGHSQSYVTTELETTRKKVRELEQQIQRLEGSRSDYQRWLRTSQEESRAIARRLAATRGVVTRQKNRARKGMCPVEGCRRHFANLLGHVEGQHPAWCAEHPDKLAEALELQMKDPTDKE